MPVGQDRFVAEQDHDIRMSLLEIYNAFFEVVPATTPETLEMAHRLRYQVYCVENDFEASEDNPGGLEIDVYDRRSSQSILIHRATGKVAGTVRLILPDDDGAKGLPAVTSSGGLQDLGSHLLPPQATAEISRFAISKEFRRRVEDGRWPAVNDSADCAEAARTSRRVLPHMTLGLMQAIVQMSVDNNVTHWCANVETPLLRLLKRMGIQFNPVGCLVNFHGWRQPVYGSVSDILGGIYDSRPEVWEVITRSGDLWKPPTAPRRSMGLTAS